MKINRKIKDFSGENLIIGCGADHDHYFSLTAEGVHSADLHPSKNYYTVSLDASCSPDIEGDFFDPSVKEHLSGKKFKTICFEVTTGMLNSTEALEAAIATAKELLTNDGILFIFRSDRGYDATKQRVLAAHFRYDHSFYSRPGAIWSALISNTPIDLTLIKASNPYFKHLLEQLSATDEEKLEEGAASGGGYCPPRLLLRSTPTFFSPSRTASEEKPADMPLATKTACAAAAGGGKS